MSVKPDARLHDPQPPGRSLPAGRMTAIRRLCLAIVVVACAEFVIATTGVQIQNLPRSTDFATYYLAGDQTRDLESPYDDAALAARGRALGFPYEQFPFLYPPQFALVMQPFARLSYPRARQVWMLIATLALLAAVGLTAALMRRQARLLGVQNQAYEWILLAAFVPSALNSTSVHNDIRAGSVGILLFLTLVAVAWGLTSKRYAWLGTALALATLIKLTPVVAIPYVAWRRAARAAALALGLLGVTMLPVLVHWGWGIVPDYVQNTLLPNLGREFARPINQSLDAVLSRALVPSSTVQSPFDLPWLKQMLSIGLSVVIALMTLRLLSVRARAQAMLPVEFGFLIVTVLMLMKITWVHTLTAMLFVWPVLMLAIVRAREVGCAGATHAGVWACVGFFLSSAHLPIQWQALRQGPLTVLTNVHFMGLLILWFACRWMLQREREMSEAPPSPA